MGGDLLLQVYVRGCGCVGAPPISDWVHSLASAHDAAQRENKSEKRGASGGNGGGVLQGRPDQR
jgi:hypothetical protein